MFKDKITVRVQTRFRSLRADHGTPYLQKCRRAREILAQVYQDRELCITENMIRRSDYLRGRSFWRSDAYYTEAFELDLIDSRLEEMIAGTEPAELPSAAPQEETPPPPAALLHAEALPEEAAPEDSPLDEPEACRQG